MIEELKQEEKKKPNILDFIKHFLNLPVAELDNFIGYLTKPSTLFFISILVILFFILTNSQNKMGLFILLFISVFLFLRKEWIAGEWRRRE